MRVLFIALTLAAGQALALDLNTMTAVRCKPGSGKGISATAKMDCGTVLSCHMPVICDMVDNGVLKNEYGGDITKAAAGAKDFLTYDMQFVRRTVAIPKLLWSEASGKNPRFINSEGEAYCVTKDPTCPNPLKCMNDSGTTHVDEFDPAKLQTQEASSAPGVQR